MFGRFWANMANPPLSSGNPVRCPICYPIPNVTQGKAPQRCPFANPLVFVDTPETRNFYPAPTPNQILVAPGSTMPLSSGSAVTGVSSQNLQKKKRSLSQASNTDRGIYTDCMLCEELFLVPFGTRQSDPAAYTCSGCRQNLSERCHDGSGNSSSASSSSAEDSKRLKR